MMLERIDLGAVLLFETSNIRYATATQIGYWAFNKGERWALITRDERPKVWDFGSAAKAHRLQLPHLYDEQNSIGGNTGLQGAIGPTTGLHARAVARDQGRSWRRPASPTCRSASTSPSRRVLALQRSGIEVRDGQQAMLRRARDQEPRRDHAAEHGRAMGDGVYQDIFEALKPGVRENEIVALANKRLYEMGSDCVEAINAIAGERCSPHPHNFTDRMIRPGDQAYFDIIQSSSATRPATTARSRSGSATRPSTTPTRKRASGWTARSAW